jgi:hypothetical protein
VGQTVAASLQAPTLFTIAQDLHKMQAFGFRPQRGALMIRPDNIVAWIW